MNMNRVILGGHLTRDPTQRFLPSGQAVTDAGLAINRKYTANGEKREEVCFVDLSAWAGTGDLLVKYLKKGDPLVIEGRLKYDQWEKDGQKRNKLSVVVDQIHFVGSKAKEELSTDLPITHPNAAPGGGADETPPF